MKYGRDLLAEEGRPREVAEGLWCPKRRSLARRQERRHGICPSAGSSSEFGGIPSEESPPSYEYLQGRVDLKALDDFQVEVQRKLMSRLGSSEGGRAIVALPTGAGKTRVAVETIRGTGSRGYEAQGGGSSSRTGKTAGWVAHSSELCEEAYLCFKQVWENSDDVCDLLLIRFWGRFTQDLSEHRKALRNVLTQASVLVTTPNRLVNLVRGEDAETQELLQNLIDSAALLVVDEAHRAATPSYRLIFEKFNTPRIIGLTATPFRKEYFGVDPEAGTKELSELFRVLLEPREVFGNEEPRAALQRRKVLAQPKFMTVRTTTVLQAPHAQRSGEPNGRGHSRKSIRRCGCEQTIRRAGKRCSRRCCRTASWTGRTQSSTSVRAFRTRSAWPFC
ncbi:MAG: DEAD/DEAH box helicase family protein [Burkholderiaceae bacterium]|nr:DEAD/DEAH box helicase family protein [Burkholderiaceae bacterium]